MNNRICPALHDRINNSSIIVILTLPEHSVFVFSSIHYSQFQMQSGVTGMNAVRLYNPIKQSLDHALRGKFIRRYVPELKPAPNMFIHEPWRMDSSPADYPQPVVRHEAAIKHAREEIAKRFKSEEFWEQSSEPLRKK